MRPGLLRFGRFLLDADERLLSRDGVPIEVRGRYFDALALLAGEAGKLVSKDRFLDEVWHGVPVTDEALTQCIRTLRRALGDDAGRPTFIETVPRHGYRFIAAVEPASPRMPARDPSGWRDIGSVGGAGTVGGAAAGLIGGTVYGLAATGQGVGSLSVLLVLVWITLLLAAIGGAGVSFGIAIAGARGTHPGWQVAGGALGGLIVGTMVKLVGLDAFGLLFGRSPGDMTGGVEGAALGATVGLGLWLAQRAANRWSIRRGVAAAAMVGALGGGAIPMAGGLLMAGSLDLLAHRFDQARFSLDPIGALFGEVGVGSVAAAVTGALEGALFAGCISGAMLLVRRSPRG